MSIGNLKDYGNKGNNFPFQLKVLQGLEDVISAISGGGSNVTIVGPLGSQNCNDSVSVALCTDQALTLDDILVKLTAVTRTPNLLRVTGAGTIAPAVYDFSVSNVGTGNGSILGGTIKPGETLNFGAGALNNIYAAGSIAYDGTGTELVIIYNS